MTHNYNVHCTLYNELFVGLNFLINCFEYGRFSRSCPRLYKGESGAPKFLYTYSYFTPTFKFYRCVDLHFSFCV